MTIASIYCERLSNTNLSAAFWAEPLNAASNLAFLLAAWAVLRLLRSRDDTVAWEWWWLTGLLALIGAGSFLWHTLPVPWAEWANVLPIFLFVCGFFLSTLLRTMRLPAVQAAGWFALLLTASVGLIVLPPHGTLNGSLAYVPSLAALWLLAWQGRRRGAAGANALAWAALVFSFSLILRTIDRGICPVLPVGTHFLWHALNGVTLYLAMRALLGAEVRAARGWWRAGAVLLAVVLIFLAGPRVSLNIAVQPVVLPQTAEALEEYLRTAEATQPGIVPGTEKTIVWAHPATRERTPLALVYLHGFSASRQEIAPVVEQVAARLGANVFYTRLTGHGRGGAAMLDASVNAWAQDGVEALAVTRQLGDKVVVIGTSTGGTLAVWLLANGYDQNVAAAILVSPNFAPRDPKSEFLIWPWGETIARMVAGPTWRFLATNELSRRYWTYEFPIGGLLPMMGMVEVTRRSNLARIQTPLLTIYSTQDKVVNSTATERNFARIGTTRKRLLRFENSSDTKSHVLAGAAKSPSSTAEVRDLMLEFLQELQAPQFAWTEIGQ
ncbi:MAG: alpha/beta fold hydrolase [Burkholderiaceae bacterium]|nr:MAG: alpha/beta fold hydrolase [Burkholderiaceae bacterium]